MPTFQFKVSGHDFTVKASAWSGRERVWVDGRIVSDRRSFRNDAPHDFTMDENGTPVKYRVFLRAHTAPTVVSYRVERGGLTVATGESAVLFGGFASGGSMKDELGWTKFAAGMAVVAACALGGSLGGDAFFAFVERHFYWLFPLFAIVTFIAWEGFQYWRRGRGAR